MLIDCDTDSGTAKHWQHLHTCQQEKHFAVAPRQMVPVLFPPASTIYFVSFFSPFILALLNPLALASIPATTNSGTWIKARHIFL